jgi:glycosyltransferase involved in cell wall biosynthesis
MKHSERVVIVLPALNAERTLSATLAQIPDGTADEILLVDDGSRDRTPEVAERLGIPVITHPRNLGYGANQKTCYREALARGADLVVMLHPDQQYDARVIPAALSVIRLDICDVMLGNRIRTRREARDGGMPLYKYAMNRALSFIENVVTGHNLGEWHTGLRCYRREVLETIPFARNSDDFVFDSQFLIQCVHFGFRLGDLPVPARYHTEASSIGLVRSCRYGALTLWTLVRWLLHRSSLVESPLFRPSAAAPAHASGGAGASAKADRPRGETP